MLVPTRRFAAVVAVSAVAVLLAPVAAVTGWLVVVGALAVVLAVDTARAPAPASIEVTRQLPAVLALGQPGTITWRVRHLQPRPVTIAVADQLAPSLQATTRRFRARVPPNADTVIEAGLRPSRRGAFSVAELVVRTEGPMGLAARQGRRDDSVVLRVVPSFRSHDEAELRIDKARILEVGLRSAKGRGGGTDFDQLREYSVDDEYRRIDWAATARTGKPIVRTYRAERNQIVVNLLDNGRVMAASVGGVPRVEHAMDAVMMLTTVATRLGDRCGLVAFDREVRAVVPPSNARGQFARVVDAMFDLQPVLSESDYRGAFVETLVRFRKRALIVIHTDLVEQAVGESLLPALPILSRSHIVVVAAAQDPAVRDWAGGAVSDVEHAYRRAAAVGALEERRRAIARLRGCGATVVDAPPARLAAELADTYLRLKATSRL